MNQSKSHFKLSINQINPTVGNVQGNLDIIIARWKQAAQDGSDLAVFPEMCLSGYPLQDLVHSPNILNHCQKAIQELVKLSSSIDCALIVGAPEKREDSIFNTAYVIDQKQILAKRDKQRLPNHSVFDEVRDFASGLPCGPVMIRGVKVGLLICEDLWHDDPVECIVETGGELLLAINASPYEKNKKTERIQTVAKAVQLSGLPCVYINMVGAQDELMFDGASFIINHDYKLVLRLPDFISASEIAIFERQNNGSLSITKSCCAKTLDPLEELYTAAQYALHDYIHKNGFKQIVLGLSGGIDSALSAAIAADAIDADNVTALIMPSQYTSTESLADAYAVCKLLGIKYHELSIDKLYNQFESTLGDVFLNTEKNIAEENIQARIRGDLLMSYSNKFGHMVLTTGNKSEIACGYATLYGDMCGGYSVLKDLYKTEVFSLALWRNSIGKVIPQRIIDKPPSAELRFNQRDDDTLPPYDVLDKILEATITDNLSLEEICKIGFERETVIKVLNLLQRSEYKRFQAAPGVRLSKVAFGRDWRYPLINATKNY